MFIYQVVHVSHTFVYSRFVCGHVQHDPPPLMQRGQIIPNHAQIGNYIVVRKRYIASRYTAIVIRVNRMLVLVMLRHRERETTSLFVFFSESVIKNDCHVLYIQMNMQSPNREQGEPRLGTRVHT